MTWMSWPVLSRGLRLDLALKVSVCRVCNQAAPQGVIRPPLTWHLRLPNNNCLNAIAGNSPMLAFGHISCNTQMPISSCKT